MTTYEDWRDQSGGGSGSIDSIAVNAANGFAGSVTNPTGPNAQINIQTTVTGILKGNGTAVSDATGADIISSNVLTLASGLLTSTIDGVASNTVTIPSAVPTTNTLVNNLDNTLTSTVDGIDSTADIVTTAFPTKPDTNHITMSVNGVGNTQVAIVDTVTNSAALNQMSVAVNGVTGTSAQIVTNVQLSLVGSDLTSTINGVASAPLDLSPIIPPTTTNTLANNGDNTITSTVNGIDSTTEIVSVNAIYKGVNNFSTAVNGLLTGPSQVVDTNVLSLTGTNLKSSVNTFDSNNIDIQIPIASPTNNNLVSMDATGHVKDALAQITTSALSNDNAHVMTSAAVQTAIANSPSGSVSSVSVVSANGFAGSVATPTTTPAITMSTSVTGILKGNGTSVSAAVATDIPTTNTISSAINTVTSNVNGVSSNTAIVNSHTLTSSVNTMTDSVNGVSASAPIINTNALNSTTNTLTSTVNGIATTGVNIINSHTLTSSVNTMTDSVNGVSANAPIINTSVISTSANNATVMINGVASATAPIINTIVQAQSIVNDNFTTTINGVVPTATALCPSQKGGFTQPTFTNLSEYVLLLAPNGIAIGKYCLQLVDANGQVLGIDFTVCGCTKAGFNTSKIQVTDVIDSLGVITSANISTYVLFRGYYRTNVTNPYFAVTFSMPYTLPYTNPISINTYQYGSFFLNENSTITSTVGVDVNTLFSTAPPDLCFRMRLSTLAASASTPQCYMYAPASSSSAIFQSAINTVTGVPSALSPASFTTPSPYKIAVTTLRNYMYGVVASGTSIYQFRIATNGTLSALSPSTITGPSTCTGVVVDPTDRFVYVCSFGGPFGQFTITKSTGQLVAIASAPAGAAQMQDLTCHPSGRYLYGANSGSGLIYQYSINQTTGALTALATLTVAAGAGPIKIIVHPSGLFAYVVNNNATGAGNISVFSVNTTTGQLTLASTFTPVSTGNMQGICISNNGLFICYSSQTSNVVTTSSINQSTGAISAAISSQSILGARDCCFDYTGAFLFTVNDTNNRIDGSNFNQTTGVLTAGSNVASGANVNNIVAI